MLHHWKITYNIFSINPCSNYFQSNFIILLNDFILKRNKLKEYTYLLINKLHKNQKYTFKPLICSFSWNSVFYDKILTSKILFSSTFIVPYSIVLSVLIKIFQHMYMYVNIIIQRGLHALFCIFPPKNQILKEGFKNKVKDSKTS